MQTKTDIAVEIGGKLFAFVVDRALAAGTIVVPTFGTIDTLVEALGGQGDETSAPDSRTRELQAENDKLAAQLTTALRTQDELKRQNERLLMQDGGVEKPAPANTPTVSPAGEGAALVLEPQRRNVALGKQGVTPEQVAVAISHHGAKLSHDQRTVLEMRYGLGRYQRPADFKAIGAQFRHSDGWAGGVCRDALRLLGLTVKTYPQLAANARRAVAQRKANASKPTDHPPSENRRKWS